jgi:anthranilate 1,2-dioxygenase small subunit
MAIQLPDLERFYFDYAACLDEERYSEWPGFFTQDCSYEVLSRENFDQNLPAPLMSCYSNGMAIDRVSMLVKGTLTYRKMYQKRFVTNVRILEESSDTIQSAANVLIIQSDLEGVSSLYMTGTYRDVVETGGERLLLRNRRVIVDSFGIDTMLAVPV